VGYGSLKIIENGTIRKYWCGFLFVFDSNQSINQSRIFTARCICINAVYAGTRCLCVRLSVCVSVCHVRELRQKKDIFEFISLSGSQAILVFLNETGWRYSDGNSPNGGVECKGVWKNDDFRPISRSISETVIVRQAHAARQFVSIEFCFHPYNI